MYIFTCPAFAKETDASQDFGNMNFFFEKGDSVFGVGWGVISPKILK